MYHTMAQKLVLLVFFVCSCKAVLIDPDNNSKDAQRGHLETWRPVKVHPSSFHGNKYYEHFTYPKYEFEYAVSDKKTGDHKRHRESRDGDRVYGEYSLVEPDGSLRKVQYNADDYNGFNAVVSKTVNKHSDHAYSVSDHTRHFYPIGHGIKINHFFPNKEYQYHSSTEAIQTESKEPTPVEEAKIEGKMVLMSGDSVMVLEPVDMTEQTETKAVDITKVKVADTPVIVNPTVVSMIMNNHELNTATENVMKVEEPKIESDEIKSEEDQSPDSPPDSEVASSYYHTRFYYVGF